MQPPVGLRPSTTTIWPGEMENSGMAVKSRGTRRPLGPSMTTVRSFVAPSASKQILPMTCTTISEGQEGGGGSNLRRAADAAKLDISQNGFIVALVVVDAFEQSCRGGRGGKNSLCISDPELALRKSRTCNGTS
jgi:hypothetical protein